MKLDTVLMIIKGVGLIGVGVCSAYNSGISQWSNSGEWPSAINWHGIISNTLAAGFGAMVAFSSSSVSKWVSARTNGNGQVDNTVKPVDPVKP